MLGGDDGPHTGLIAFRPIPHRVDGGTVATEIRLAVHPIPSTDPNNDLSL